MRNITEINIKNKSYYFLDDMGNINNFDSNLLKIDRKSYKHINIYCIGYITKQDSRYANIDSVKLLHFFVYRVDGFIEEKDENKYLNSASTDKNKDVLKKYPQHWDGIKNFIGKIDISEEYRKDYMKIKFNSDDNLPLNR